jgi:hypothetical protein
VSRKSIFSVITFGLLAVATTSCGGGEAPKPTESKAPQAAANASPAAAPAVAAPATGFSQPLVAAKEKETDKKADEAAKPNDTIVAGLLPGTDSDSVVRSTTKGRTDPFSGVVLNTTTETKTTKIAQASSLVAKASPSVTQPTKIASTSVTKVTTIAAPRSIPSISTPSSPRKPGSGLGLASAAATLAKKTAEPTKIAKLAPTTNTPGIKPVNTPGISAPAAKPNPEVATRDIPPSVAPAPIPQPNLARAIGVSGVSQVNGQTQVIVKLPTESFSRYVSVGERLMDGKVLVKRVQEFSGTSPVVILEEVGIEVPRKIGDKPVVEKDDAKK